MEDNQINDVKTSLDANLWRDSNRCPHQLEDQASRFEDTCKQGERLSLCEQVNWESCLLNRGEEGVL